MNTASGGNLQYRWDDPRLKWRTFKFENDTITNDAEEFKDECKNVSFKSIHTTFQDAMLRSIGGYDYPPRAYADPISDYRLNSDSENPVRLFSAICGNNLWQADLGISYPKLGNSAIRGAWIILASEDKLYLRWRNESILTLEKLKDGTFINASFDCSKSTNETERTICNSNELISFDRSVNEAYVRLLQQSKDTDENEKHIVDSQRLWIKKRNTCHSYEKCILSLMKARLEFLVEQNRT
ncbi:lysozyme inhibitor LprI family protein [Paraburkholderia caffeinilytica]|uniref:Lysozyme inhibitor LprI-like N-terminal domain-containing protein n=1 Tax=Paraburkholderia caffeinilytica TaxID=1761016 RepID=A0ABQ1N0V1_9BURK|nr:lysozyme inhibitor LprI family protein [Paraburkholderia caffeinilytica]GGC50415.1 hypothetical protein GCM10011400_42290 [Paraburkholderia caffeinilytica]